MGLARERTPGCLASGRAFSAARFLTWVTAFSSFVGERITNACVVREYRETTHAE